jgi:hypothetical protein
MNPKIILRGVVALLVAGFCLFSVEGLLAQSKERVFMKMTDYSPGK